MEESTPLSTIYFLATRLIFHLAVSLIHDRHWVDGQCTWFTFSLLPMCLELQGCPLNTSWLFKEIYPQWIITIQNVHLWFKLQLQCKSQEASHFFSVLWMKLIMQTTKLFWSGQRVVLIPSYTFKPYADPLGNKLH